MNATRSHKSYRPVTVATFKLNNLIGGMEPWGFHIGNVVIHSWVSALFCVVAANLFSNVGLGFCAGLLFASHAIHTEAVCLLDVPLSVNTRCGLTACDVNCMRSEG